MPHSALQILLVGGTFDAQGGRPSGYLRQMAAALQSALPEDACRVVNGGTLAELEALPQELAALSHVFWFADVSNDHPKLLRQFKQAFPRLVLVSSKNNRRGRYRAEELFERLEASQSRLLLEFTDGPDGRLLATLLGPQRRVVLAACPDIPTVARSCLAELGLLPVRVEAPA